MIQDIKETIAFHRDFSHNEVKMLVRKEVLATASALAAAMIASSDGKWCQETIAEAAVETAVEIIINVNEILS